jgi:hypothetical protein
MKEKNICNNLLDHPAPVICCGFPPVSSALVMRIQLQTLQEGDTQFITCRNYRIQHHNMGFALFPLKCSRQWILDYFRHAEVQIFGQMHDPDLTLLCKTCNESSYKNFFFTYRNKRTHLFLPMHFIRKYT